jgi:hypothetical protein
MSDASWLREKVYSHNVVHEFDRRNLVRGFVLKGGKKRSNNLQPSFGFTSC